MLAFRRPRFDPKHNFNGAPGYPIDLLPGPPDRSQALGRIRHHHMEDRTMRTYTVTYNVTLTIEVQADSEDEAERLADRELPSHCDVDCAVVCHRIATAPARTREDN
jgi:hypothetical protein